MASLRQAIKAWWQARALREKRLLVATAVVALVVLFDGLLWRPFIEQRARLQQQVKTLAETAALAERLAEQAVHRKPEAQKEVDLLAFIDREATRLGLKGALARLRPQPASEGRTRMLVELRNAPFDRVMQMLAAARQAGIDLAHLRMQRAEQEGHVHARMELVQ